MITYTQSRILSVQLCGNLPEIAVCFWMTNVEPPLLPWILYTPEYRWRYSPPIRLYGVYAAAANGNRMCAFTYNREICEPTVVLQKGQPFSGSSE